MARRRGLNLTDLKMIYSRSAWAVTVILKVSPAAVTVGGPPLRPDPDRLGLGLSLPVSITVGRDCRRALPGH